MTCYTNKHTIQKALKSKASVCFCMHCAYPFFISSLITLIFVNSTSVCGNASSSMFVFLLVSSVFEDSLLMRYNFFKGNFSLKILLLISKNKTNTQIYNMLYIRQYACVGIKVLAVCCLFLKVFFSSNIHVPLVWVSKDCNQCDNCCNEKNKFFVSI